VGVAHLTRGGRSCLRALYRSILHISCSDTTMQHNTPDQRRSMFFVTTDQWFLLCRPFPSWRAKGTQNLCTDSYTSWFFFLSFFWIGASSWILINFLYFCEARDKCFHLCPRNHVALPVRNVSLHSHNFSMYMRKLSNLDHLPIYPKIFWKSPILIAYLHMVYIFVWCISLQTKSVLIGFFSISILCHNMWCAIQTGLFCRIGLFYKIHLF